LLIGSLCSGEVLAWGFNGAGELGDGTFENRNEPVKVQNLGGRVIKLFVSSVSGAACLPACSLLPTKRACFVVVAP